MRLGIIGTGRIAKRAVKELDFVEGVRLRCVYNPHEGRAQEFVKRAFSGDDAGSAKANEAAAVTTTDDFEKLIESIDAAYIASPHGSHYSYAKDLLNAGKHVLCEKPMCFSEAEARQLFEIAAKKDLVLMEGIKTAFCPGFKKIEEVVESGVIGDIIDVEAAFTRLTAAGCREYDDTDFGGSFTEFGSYDLLPIFRFLGMDYDKIEFMNIKADTGVDGYAKAVFTYSGRATATAKTGLMVKSEGQLLITGTQNCILVPSPWWLTRNFEIRSDALGKTEKYTCEFEGDGLRYEFAEFVRRMSESTSDSVKNPVWERNEAIARAGVYEKFLSLR
ncbi:MAG: Gfo/Idh/MocA family oxidoreductase [Butyrivibrio sp.]|nr:Gfo/Idh/MocA family oxidoreductase [Butyrivibrio sp.]